MPSINSIVPSMVQGMSQQAPELRLPSQGDYQLNGFSHQTFGLGKRLGTDHIKILANVDYSYRVWANWVSRDDYEKYLVMYDGSKIRAFGLEGTEYTVVGTQAAFDYLNSSFPSSDLLSVSIADTTVIVNRTKTTALSADVIPEITNSTAVVWIKQGAYGQDYNIELDINGTTVVSKFMTSTVDANSLKTDLITKQLIDQLENNSTFSNVYTISHTAGQSWFTISRTVPDPLPFDCSVYDSRSNSLIGLVQHTADSFDLLPPTAPEDYICKVLGNPGESEDDYWVQFSVDRDAGTTALGLWTECRGPGSYYKLDNTTMPHALSRYQDDAEGTYTGTPFKVFFKFEPINWYEGKCGDDNSVKAPGFVGSQITAACVYQSRLVFAYRGSVFMSRTNDIFNLWRSSATQIVDTDPIDIDITVGRLVDDQVLNIRHVLSFAEELLLVGNRAQISIPGNEPITPKTVRALLSSSFECDNDARPIAVESSVFMCHEAGGFTAVREYFVDGSSRVKRSNIITSSIPRLIYGRPAYMTACPSESMLFVSAYGDQSVLHVYKYYDLPNGQRVISSWGMWSFGHQILNHEVVGSTLWMLINRPEGVTMESLEIPAFSQTTNTDFPYHMDRKVPLGTATMYSRFAVQTDEVGSVIGTSDSTASRPFYGGSTTTYSPSSTVNPSSMNAAGVPGDDVGTVQTTPNLGGGGSGTGAPGSGDDIGGSPSGPGPTSPGGTGPTPGGSLPRYDNRERGRAEFHPETNTTTFEFPWSPSACTVVVRADTHQIIASGEGELEAQGDWTSYPLYAGCLFDFKYRFNQANLAKQDQMGGVAAIRSGDIQVIKWNVNYTMSGPFYMHAHKYNETSKSKLISPIRLGINPSSPLGEGRGSILVMNKNIRSRVDLLSSTFMPCWFVSADWDGEVRQERQLV